jgi:lipopolysaccharide export system protein LptA
MSDRHTEHNTRRTLTPGIFLAGALAVLLIAGGSWWFLRGQHGLVSPAKPTATIADDIEVRLDRPIIRGVSRGKIIWEIKADHFDLAKNRPLVHIRGLKRVAMMHDGKAEFEVTATELEQNRHTGDLNITGNVTLTGNKLIMRTPTVSWDNRRQVLDFPGKLSAQIGDFSLTAAGGSYDVRAATLHANGPVTLTTQGNTMRAAHVEAAVLTQRFALSGPVSATLEVADIEEWTAGNRLPAIPPIPDGVRARYRDYCIKRGIAVKE